MEPGLVIAAIVVIAGAAAVIVTTHLAGIGRLPRQRIAGIRVKATLASDEAWRTAHRAATPIVWLTGSICAIAALGALGFAGSGASTEATVLLVFGLVVLLVGIALGAWRGIAAVR